ncbi:EF-P 5-aminopentanol modification-associated protein YfmF [Brevibacillus laterosporus]|uniref:EF-P 5-aminopentanol modification-associated protein YfmF n=1 Tax=Brevibacillus laterosporus TaxID=1465 RepID=UPI000CE3524F|nr:pitrilysin family protein [Brevibacillus laterosporus]MBG9775461.1 peptidase [Brevibacillus laterosporus]MBG9800126.1 peptidase [Brevibacillus laterosporus]MED1909167.1 pitrilysin family protein [Brevibacillus laterosporus]PPA87026.1 insulinase family protein [Brevibacillus laterosporus]
MAEKAQEIAFTKSQVNGMNLHILQTEKFKSITMIVNIEQELTEEYASKTALLAMVLKRATARFPEPQKLRQHLDYLYGAIFDVDVAKKGERQILQLYMEVPNEKYLSGNQSLVEDAIEFVGDILTRPYLVNDQFDSTYVEAEKKSLTKKIESIVNDKMRYANQRITEEMFKGEPYATSAIGTIAHVTKIDAASLTDYYRQFVENNPLEIFVVGDVKEDEITSLCKKHLQLPSQRKSNLDIQQVSKKVTEQKAIVDRMDVNQAKLNIGCRSNIVYKDDDYPALLVYNGILGGFPHSKLFLNVREKASLAYYAVSRLESHKGVVMMMSGIDVNNYEKAVTIIKEQMAMMENGEISQEEMDMTKATLYNQFKELLDSGRMMVDFAYNGVISGRARDLQTLLSEIEKVKVQDVVNVAHKIELDTIYLLRDKKGGE